MFFFLPLTDIAQQQYAIETKCHISVRNQVIPVQNLAEATGTVCLVKDAKCIGLRGAKGGCNKKAAFDGGCFVWGCVL